jgi:hypothetical protein
MAPSIPISIPFKGLNTLNPFIDWESAFARELTNYAIFNGSLLMRPGVEVVNESEATGAVFRTMWFDASVPSSILINGDVINTETRAVITTIGGTCQVKATRIKHISLDLVIGLREPRLAVSPYTAWGFTSNTVTATAITSACSYKGRMCVCDGSTIEFSPVGNISGNMSSASGGGAFPISYLMDGQTVSRMFSVSVQNGNYADSVYAIFGNGGKVLVYQGAYPGSADWNIIGNFNMPAPAGNVAFTEVDGDILVVTNRYAYWFNDLFRGDAQTAYNNSPTRPIENIWQLMGWSNSTFPITQTAPFSFYYAPLDCIVVATNTGSTDPNFDLNTKIAFYQNETVYFVYFRKYQGWAVWLSTPVNYPVVNNVITDLPQFTTDVGSIAQYNNNRVFDQYYYNSSGLRYLPITTSWKTPYYYPQSGKTRNVAGVQPFYRNTENGAFNLIRIIFDQTDMNAPFGFYSQPTAITPALPANYTSGNINVAAQTSNVYREFCGVGGEGACFSAQFTQEPNGVDEDADLQMQIYLASISFTEGANYPA